MKPFSISLLITPSKVNVETVFIVWTVLLTEQRNASTPNSLDQLMQLISLTPHIDEKNWRGGIDLRIFQKKLYCKVKFI